MEKVLDTIKLMAKTGLFFAHCDGDFGSREHDFINGFLNGILEIGDIDEGLQNEVKDSLNHTYTLDEIVEETKALVADFNDDERKAILFVISQFILKVVASDSEVAEAERENFRLWKEAFGL